MNQFSDPRYILHTDSPGLCRECGQPIYVRDAIFTASEQIGIRVAFHKQCWEEMVCRQIIRSGI